MSLKEYMSEQEEHDLNEYIDGLKDIYESIDLSKITILTGNNGTGKSLLRKLISSKVVKQMNGKVKSISMDTRTASNPEWGALSSAMHDDPWIATSINTYALLKSVIKAVKDSVDETKYLILDEFEIGCSEETILAFVDMLNKELIELPIGCLIITHSRFAVNNLTCAEQFLNLQGLTKEEWVNRKIIPTDLNVLQENKLFFAVRERLTNKE